MTSVDLFISLDSAIESPAYQSQFKKGPSRSLTWVYSVIVYRALWRACLSSSQSVLKQCWSLGQHCSGLVSTLIIIFTAVFEPVAFAVHLKDMEVVGQSIQQCAYQPFGTKDFSPFIEGQVSDYDDGTTLVTLVYDLEEQFDAQFSESADKAQ